MLHAELHGKIAHDVSNIARREDMLTSTVFGTLFTAGADATVRAWLAKARTPTGEPLVLPPDAAVDDYWFWPRLDGTEPDVLLRLGSLLVIVEAKYRSPRSSDDQLEREWTACKQPASPVFRGDIRAAIDECSARALVYVVQRSRVARELPYVAQSITRVPGARMYLLTWEDLDEVLPPRGGPRWQRELRQYLRVREITAFRGFASTLSETTPSLVAALSTHHRSAWPRVMHPDAIARVASLRRWQPGFERRKP